MMCLNGEQELWSCLTNYSGIVEKCTKPDKLGERNAPRFTDQEIWDVQLLESIVLPLFSDQSRGSCPGDLL